IICSSSRINRRKGAWFSIARTTDHAIITEGEGACFGLVSLAASRARRTASQRASICRFAEITWLSLRVIVGESAGSIAVARVAGLDIVSRLFVVPLRSSTAATGAETSAVLSGDT